MTEFHVEEVWQQHTIVTGCKNCTEKYTKTDLTCLGMGHIIARLHMGKVVTDSLSKYEWEVLSYAPYSPDESTGLRLIPQFKRAHAWTPFPLPYPSHRRTEQKWYPKWNSKSSKTLGCGHWEAGGLRRKII